MHLKGGTLFALFMGWFKNYAFCQQVLEVKIGLEKEEDIRAKTMRNSNESLFCKWHRLAIQLFGLVFDCYCEIIQILISVCV